MIMTGILGAAREMGAGGRETESLKTKRGTCALMQTERREETFR